MKENQLTDLVQVESRDTRFDVDPSVPKNDYINYGIDLVGKICHPIFESQCGIEVELKSGEVFLNSKKIWQALPTNRFYCPTFAMIDTPVTMTIGSMTLIVRNVGYDAGLFVYAISKMRPKRGQTKYRHFAGITAIDIQRPAFNAHDELLNFIEKVHLPESAGWFAKVISRE